MKKTPFYVLIGVMSAAFLYFGFRWYRGSSILENNFISEQDGSITTGQENETPAYLVEKDPEVEAMEKAILQNLPPTYQLQANLSNVFGGDGSGIVQAGFIEGKYQLTATFENLPLPGGTDFYEGWVVRDEPKNVVSTGKVSRTDEGVFMNFFTNDEDLSDYTRYILTIEPDDGDPAPAAHVLEGEFLTL